MWLGYWRVLSAVCSGGRERGGRDGGREDEKSRYSTSLNLIPNLILVKFEAKDIDKGG